MCRAGKVELVSKENSVTLIAAAPKQGEPRSGEPSEGAAAAAPDPEVASKPDRRSFTADYKLRILHEVDQAGPGQVGAILRREGLYSSHLTEWRRARTEGALGALSKKRGRKARPVNPLESKVAQLERELARTREELRKARIILDVQGKVSKLLGIDLASGKDS